MKILSNIAAIVAFWVVTSIGFNDFTPRFLAVLREAGGHVIDVTIVELSITILIASTMLKLNGRRVVPVGIGFYIFIMGGLHLAGCRLFMKALSLSLPVSLAQTIRAMNPLFAVAIGFATGNRYRLSIIASLIPIVIGFGLAVSADLNVDPEGVLAAVGSVMCLVGVNTVSKRLHDDTSNDATSSELQCWVCISALGWLIPFWAAEGGPARLAHTFQNTPMLWVYSLMDGALYFCEQIAQFAAIASMAPLTLAVTDTVRRLLIVIFAGFVLQGNPWSVSNVTGACLVCAGAAYYAKKSKEDNSKNSLEKME